MTRKIRKTRPGKWYPTQKSENTACPDCGTDVVAIVEHGLTQYVDACQAPINRTPIQLHNDGWMVWRRNLATGVWRYNPGSPRGENPVHLGHVCPTVGRT